MLQLCRAVTLVVTVLALPSPVHADDTLPVDPVDVVDMIVATGILQADQFEQVDDRYVGRLLVGGAAETGGENVVGRGISAVIYPGEDGTRQIQFILEPPWGDLRPRVEAMAAVVTDIAGPTPPGPPFPAEDDPVRAAMGPAAQWLYGIMLESWNGWPGSPQRVVRTIGDVAVIVEGVPPDIWGVTIVADEGYGDWTWPGISPDSDSEEVAAARLAIRRGDYAAAMALLETAGARDEAAAGALLGDMYRLGRLGVVDEQSAANWYLVAGRQQYGPGIFALAMLSKEGLGVMFMNSLRLPLIVDAAEVGMADALYMLSGQENGVFYTRPPGVTAFDQVKMAAEWGLLSAQQDVAARYAAGDGVEPDPLLAYAWAAVALKNTDPGLDNIRSHQLAADLRNGLSGAQIAEAKRIAKTLVSGPPEGGIDLKPAPQGE